jgi:hypothetical protein
MRLSCHPSTFPKFVENNFLLPENGNLAVCDFYLAEHYCSFGLFYGFRPIALRRWFSPGLPFGWFGSLRTGFLTVVL